ncbi:MAG: S1/P1 nuclease [Cyclobacteriaceae bacterium]
MRKLIPFINWATRAAIATFLIMCLPLVTGAWGQTGHRAIGWVAETHLTSKAKKRLAELLDGESLAMASTWMDEIRSDRKFNYMSDWHWVTIPDGKTYAQAEKNANGDIIATIERVFKELSSGHLTRDEEKERIKILIHLVGDIHQPFHVGTGEDRGGNDTKVKWFGNSSNLHRVWDSQMIDDTKLSFTELASSLGKTSKSKVKQLQNASVYVWAAESMDLRQQVYAIGDGNLSYEYSYQNIDTVRKRLMEAGVRLAGLLNQIYG